MRGLPTVSNPGACKAGLNRRIMCRPQPNAAWWRPRKHKMLKLRTKESGAARFLFVVILGEGNGPHRAPTCVRIRGLKKCDCSSSLAEDCYCLFLAAECALTSVEPHPTRLKFDKGERTGKILETGRSKLFGHPSALVISAPASAQALATSEVCNLSRCVLPNSRTLAISHGKDQGRASASFGARGLPPFAPEGLLRVARRFIAGY